MPTWELLLKQLKDEFEAREVELQTLGELDRHLLDDTFTFGATLDFIVAGVIRLLRAEYAQILLRRHEALEIVASIPTGEKGRRLDINNSVTGWVALNLRPARSGDVWTDPRFRQLYKPFQNGKAAKMMSELAVPMRYRGTAIGVLNVESPVLDAFTEHHERLLDTFAGQAAIAFKKRRLFDEAHVLSSLRPLLTSELPTAEVEIHQVLSRPLTQLSTFLGDIWHFQILFRDGDQLVIAYSSLGKDVGVRVDIDRSVTGEAILTRAPVIVSDVASHPKYIRMLGDLIRSEMAVPISVQNDVVGVLNFESEHPNNFDSFSALIVQHFSDELSTVLSLLQLRFELQARLKANRANQIIAAMINQTGNLVHRLNNLVGPIRLQAEEIQTYCQQELSANQLLATLVGKIHSGAVEALALPEQMRRLFAEIDYVSVNTVVNDIATKFRTMPGITLKVSLPDENIKIRCSALGAILFNLIQNAVDAMPHGGEIRLTASQVTFPNLSERFVEIEVADSGSGIPPEIIPRIFQWGFSTKSKESKGLGWGLAWVKTFVENVGGTISVESVGGGGATFTLRFPSQT